MGSLSNSLAIAVGALQADQGALDATTNNVANVNTPGYSRVQPILSENDPLVIGNLTYGSGVSLQKLQSIRDPILQIRIQEETRQQGQLNAAVTGLQQVQANFSNSSGGDIGSQISNFFSSLQQLSTSPTDVSLRQGVLTAASNLATSFNNTANSLIQQRSSVDLNVTQAVGQINTLTGQIAQLNTQISNLQGLGQDASAFEDQRDVLIGQLSGLIDVSQIQSDNSLTLTTSNGTPLVVGGQSFNLSTETNASGFQDVVAQGKDITSQIASGQLAGLLQLRDQQIPAVLTQLDTLASGLANGLNAANQSGFDLNGAKGTDIFVPPANGQGYAANIAVQITDPSLIAASSDGTAGSNGNVATLAAVATQTIPQLANPNLNQQNSPGSAGTLNPNDVLTVGDQTSITAGGTTFTYTNAATGGGANLNEVTSATPVTAATALASGDVITATRNGQTTTYTATAATTVGNLITAINTGIAGPVVGTNITVSGSDPQPGNYQAALVGGNVQIVDLNGNNDLTVAQTTGSELGAFTPNAAATSTVQDLINAINSDTTVGAKAALVGGNLEITDPLNRGDLAVSTTDPLLGASVGGAPTSFTTPNITTGQDPTDYYSNIVFNVGNDVSNSTANLSSAQLVLQQLQDQLGSISGVDLNEEAANMVTFQRAFDAAAEVVTTVNDMMYTVINMGTLTG